MTEAAPYLSGRSMVMAAHESPRTTKLYDRTGKLRDLLDHLGDVVEAAVEGGRGVTGGNDDGEPPAGAAVGAVGGGH